MTALLFLTAGAVSVSGAIIALAWAIAAVKGERP